MEKNQHYTREELALEESFINYVKGDNADDILFWNTWKKNNPSQHKLIDEATVLVKQIAVKPLSYDQDQEDRVWNKIKASTQHEQTTKSKSNIVRFMPWIGAVAATLLVLIYVNISSNSQQLVSTKSAQFDQLQLPEGSLVDLNAQSELSYSKKGFDNNRKVNLKGEAYFNVKKGSTFEVETNNGAIEVLGTQFNVYSRGKHFEVACISGKVKVSANGEAYILTANQNVSFNDGVKALENAEITQKRSAWRSGIYHYEDDTLGEIIKDIERQFDVEVELATGLNQLRYSGSFNSADKSTALSEVCWPLNLKFDISGNTIKIFE